MPARHTQSHLLLSSVIFSLQWVKYIDTYFVPVRTISRISVSYRRFLNLASVTFQLQVSKIHGFAIEMVIFT